MKRLIGIAVILLGAFVLVGCQTKTAATATFVVGEDGITTEGITFSITISDPEEEITGTITVRLYDPEGEEIDSRTLTTEEDWTDISFTGLDNDVTYIIKVHATIGRKTAVIGERTFSPLSTATNEITTAEQFLAMRDNRSGNYVLKNDIDFTGVEFTSPFTSSFSGTFDGGGFALSNIAITKVNSYTGVFGYVSSGTISNLVLDGVTIGTAQEPLMMATSSRVGILAGYISSTSATIENITIRNSTINYEMSSTVQAYVGAIAGENRGDILNITIENTAVGLLAKSHGIVKMGGAVGLLYDGATMKEIRSDASVTFELRMAKSSDAFEWYMIGGLIGDNKATTGATSVENIYSTGDVTITNLDFNTASDMTETIRYEVFVGGLAGSSDGPVTNAFYGGSISFTHQKNDYEDSIVKIFAVGGLFGRYNSNTASMKLVRVGTGQTISVNVSDDVNAFLSQVAARPSGSAVIEAFVYGEEHLNLNDVSVILGDTVTLITDITDIFDTWMAEAFQTVYPN